MSIFLFLHTFNNMEILVKGSLERSVQNGRVLKIDPEEIRRELPVLVPARLVRRIGQASILAANGEAVARDVVRRPVVNHPRHDRLYVVVRLIETGHTIHEGRGVGEGGVGDVWRIVCGNGGPDVKQDAVVVEDTRSSGRGSVARSQ